MLECLDLIFHLIHDLLTSRRRRPYVTEHTVWLHWLYMLSYNLLPMVYYCHKIVTWGTPCVFLDCGYPWEPILHSLIQKRFWYSRMMACLHDAGRVDAYIRLQLKRSEVVECEDEMGRDIFLYPDEDLHIQPYMNAELGVTD